MAKRKAKRKASTALVRRNAEAIAKTETPGVLGVFERLARDPRLTVEKLGELIGLQERIMAADAKRAFEMDFERMHPTLPVIPRRGKIRNKAGEVQSKYPKYEEIRAIVDPIMLAHGFTFSSRTEWPETGTLEVVGFLTHRGGHMRESRFRTVADASGGKNAIQGLGSGVQYGRRYTLTDLLSLVFEGQDDDGKAHGKAQEERKSAELPRPAAAVGHDRRSGEPITSDQRKRLFAIMRNTGRHEDEVRGWLQQRYQWASTKDITRGAYDEICRAIEAPGMLPLREPGE